MADRITLNFGANTSDLEQGTDRIADSLDDVDRKLDDVGKAGEEAGQAASDGLADTAASATDADDALGGVGNQLLGIAGIAGGVGGLVAAGVGKGVDLITEAVQKHAEAAQKLRDDLVSAYQDAAAEGEVFLSKAQIVAAASEIYFDSARLASAKDDAAAIGVDVETYVRSQAGDYEALKTVIEAAREAEAARLAELSDQSGKQVLADDERRNLSAIVDGNEKLLELHKQNQDAAVATAALSAQLSADERAQIKATSAVDQERYEGIAAQVAALQGEKVDIPVTIDTVQADADVEAFAARVRNKRITVTVRGVDQYGRTLQ